MGTLLSVKPILTMSDGEIVQASMVSSYAKGIEQLFKFAKNCPNLREVFVAYSTVAEEAEALKKRCRLRANSNVQIRRWIRCSRWAWYASSSYQKRLVSVHV